MSTYSSLKFELILTGDQSGQWGNTTNTNIGTAINEAIAGSVDITFASADLTLTLTDTNAAQSARNLRLNLTGTAGGAARTLTLGSGCQINKPYIVNNTLANAVTVKNTTGTGIAVPAGATMWLFNNGTNVVDVVSYLSSLTLGTALVATSGGTGQSSYAVGDLLYANTTTTLAKLADVATGSALISGGVTTAPSWGKIGLTTHVSGTLAATNGGTGASTTTTGDLLYGSASDTWTKLAGNTTTTRKYLVSVGSGSAATAPEWDQIDISTGDITGTLPIANGGSGQTTAQLAMNAFAGAVTSGSFLRGNGTNVVMSAIQAADVPTLNQNTTGYAAGIAGGVANKILYQSGVNTTTFIDAPTTASTFLSWNGSAFAWAAASGGGGSVPGGLANQIVYQSAPSTSTFIAAPTTASTYLSWDGSAFAWANVTPGSTFAGDISVNGLTVGRGTASVASNTALGYQANNAVTTSDGLTSVGYQANLGCTTSQWHTAIGYQANKTMSNMGNLGQDWHANTAVGYKALNLNTGTSAISYNTAVGAAAAVGLTTGGLNVSVGAGAGPSGASNATVCIGYTAARTYIGSSSVFIGSEVYSQVSGSGNTGSGITAIGYQAMYSATQGSSGIVTDRCVAVGYQALYALNPALGANSYRNTAVGSSAGSSLETGVNNLFLGYSAQPSSTTVSNEITLGNSSITTLRCQVTSITALSDARDKYDIEDLPVGLDFINSLKARRFKWDKRDAYFDEVENEDGTTTQVAVAKDGSRKSDEWNEGFIAQEVDEAATAAGADWMKIVYKSNPEKLEMTPGKLIPVLVKAIQELTARLEALEARN
jgi:hypothetical protein